MIKPERHLSLLCARPSLPPSLASMVATRRVARRTAPALSPERKAAATLPAWAAADPSKRWAEAFFLAYSPFWIVWALCVVVPLQLYEVRRREEGREGGGLMGFV